FLLSMLRIRPYDRARKTRSRRGWLGLRRTTLSFATSCRIRCRRLFLLHQLWWCKHAAYGIGLTLRHGDPRQDGIEEIEGSHRAHADEVKQSPLHAQIGEGLMQALKHPVCAMLLCFVCHKPLA